MRAVPARLPSQLVTCIFSGTLVEGGPNAIAALRRILEHMPSQTLPMAGWVSGPSGPLMIQGPAKGPPAADPVGSAAGAGARPATSWRVGSGSVETVFR